MPRIPPPTPWRTFGDQRAESEYLVMLTHVSVRRLSALPKFLSYVARVRRQLEAGPDGLVGYSLLAQPFRSNYWTLSAWDGPAALGGFIRQSPHSDAMKELPRTLSYSRTWRWDAAGNALPPAWDEALARASR